jgi:hypothetical protein
MRAIRLFGILAVMSALALPAQQDQDAAQQGPPEDRRQEREREERPAPRQQEPPQRPTLGPQPAPTLRGGPHSATIIDARRLMRVRKIYVERIDNALSDKLVEGIGSSGRFQIVADREEADAVLRGTCLDLRRLKAVRSEVYLNDRVSGAAIWQDSVRRPFNPPALSKAVQETAVMIVESLTESVVEAERR